MPPSPKHSDRSHFRNRVASVKAAARPLAVASVVAISASGLGPSSAQAADPIRVQHRLVKDGFLTADQVTGAYDTRTGAAVARWQAARGLRADGLVDADTAAVLLGTTSQSPK